MSEGISGLLQTGIWLIPLILLATIGGLYLLSHYLNKNAQIKLKKFRTDLRQLQMNRKQFESALQNYSPEDPEPFGSHAKILQMDLQQITKLISDVEHKHVAIHEQMHELTANPWRSMIGAPYDWFVIQNDISGLSLGIENVRTLVKEANEVEKSISNLSWQLALRVREVNNKHRQLIKILEKLKAWNIKGDLFENAIRREADIRTALANISSFFSQANQAVVLERATVEISALAYETLEEVQPNLEQLLVDTNSWVEDYRKVNAKTAIMQQALDEIDITLNNIPKTLELSSFHHYYEGLKVIAANLQDTLSRLEIESISQVTQETERVTKAIQNSNQEIKRGRRQLGSLDKLHMDLLEGFKRVSLLFARLGAKSTFPIYWEESNENLISLNRQANSLKLIDSSRTPEQITKDLELASNLNSELKVLLLHCQRIEETHTELTNLLIYPQFTEVDKWFQEALEISNQVDNYTPQNWSRDDEVNTLTETLLSLNRKATGLVLLEHSSPISEDDIKFRLEETRELGEELSVQAKRVNNIRAQLKQIQESEKQNAQELETLQMLFNQIDFIVKSNDFLVEIAAKELQRLRKDIQGMQNLLIERQRGTVDEKTGKIAGIVNQIEVAANQWFMQLNQEIRSVMQNLSASLTDLDEIASLDEPAVTEARHLLSSGQAAGVGVYADRSVDNLEDLVPKFKRGNDYWQSCIAVKSALKDVEIPVIDSYEFVKQNRSQAQDVLEDVSSWLKQRGSWPPTSMSIKKERQEWNRIETQWERMKETPCKAINLVQHMGKLSARYQTLSTRLHQETERVSQEQYQIEALEDEINELRQYWQKQANLHSDNPAAKQEIDDLLSAIDNKTTSLRRDYQQGRISYQQTLETLKDVHRQIRFFQVALDDNHAIDSSGNIKRRR